MSFESRNRRTVRPTVRNRRDQILERSLARRSRVGMTIFWTMLSASVLLYVVIAAGGTCAVRSSNSKCVSFTQVSRRKFGRMPRRHTCSTTGGWAVLGVGKTEAAYGRLVTLRVRGD